MLLVIDSGNTRTKWALVDDAGNMQSAEFCLNTDLAASTLKQAAQKASKALVAHVAGDEVGRKIAQLLAPLNAHFIVSKQQAGDVINGYEQAEKLGADRWAALVAAWHINKQSTLLVNAGTAITIDCLVAHESGQGLFLGGTIMPGLRLMQAALAHNTAQLKTASGQHVLFPTNTQNAIQTGCLNAAMGALLIMLQQLQQKSAALPLVMISGGDATIMAAYLKQQLEISLIKTPPINVQENLVLQGLVILQKEYI